MRFCIRMVNYRRPKIAGATVFVTVVLAHRGEDILVRYIDVLRGAVRQTLRAQPFGMDAFVVLPDHFHCVITLPDGDADYARRIGAIKARFVMGIRKVGYVPPLDVPVVSRGRFAGLKPGLRLEKREVGVWQRRFWEHHIRDERDYRNHLRYCWNNPVKHGYVTRAKDWPSSSYHRDNG
ncbi:transposase [Amylibacter cionae]|uniref:Transposase n=2 Tax=Neptunicoccus cionae TaxID=2035344 RepID=A0A916VLP0_9RHOB|nr:transposase [Amylibacter cionae]